MTTQPQASEFAPIDDPLYTLSSVPVPVDKDTMHRTETVIYPNCGQALVTAPFNDATGGKPNLEFDIEMRGRTWGNLALKLGMVFTLRGNPAAALPTTATDQEIDAIQGRPYNAPSWNMVASLIKDISLEIGGVEIWSARSDHYLEDFTARLLRNYSYEALNERSDMLFTPIGSRTYTIGHSGEENTLYQAAAVAHRSDVVPTGFGHLSGPWFGYVKPAAEDQVNPLLCNNTFFGYNPESNQYTQDPALKERVKRWASGNTHQRVITKLIPFQDLFPRIPNHIFKNVRNVKVKITWNPTMDLLEHFCIVGAAGTAAAHLATHGDVRLINAAVVTDMYFATPAQAAESVTEKQEASAESADILRMLATRVDPIVAPASGSSVRISGVANFDSLMVIQPARGWRNLTAADTTVREYQSTGEFLLFGCSNNAASTMKLRADEPVAAGTSEPVTKVYMTYDGVTYPGSEHIECSQTVNGAVCFNPIPAYREYVKACARTSRVDTAPAIPLEIFATTMPFIYIKPWADNAIHLNTYASDIQLYITGGTSWADKTGGNMLSIVVFHHKVFRIGVNGIPKLVSM